MNGKMISSIRCFTAILLALLFLLGAFTLRVSADEEETLPYGIEYTVTFQADGAVIDTKTVADGGVLNSLPQPPIHENEIFKGWFSKHGEKLTTDTIITRDLTVYARYTRLRTVSFFVNGNLYEQQTFELNGAPYVPTAPVPPTAEGMVFWGWYKDEALTEKASFPSELLTDNTVYYAKFVNASDAAIKVTFLIGNQIYEEQNLEKTSGMISVQAPLAPQSEGRLFSGWYSDEACTVKAAFPQMISEDTVFYGMFAEAGKVTFQVDGRTFAEQSFLRDGNAFTIEDPGTPAKNGYMFTGWYRDEACTKRMSLPAQITDSLTLYGQFVKISKVTFMVDGKVYYEQTFANLGTGSAITEPVPPSIDGRVFLGWFRDKNWYETNDRSSFVAFPTTVTEDTTFYAGFEVTPGAAAEQEESKGGARLTGSVFSGAGIYVLIGGGAVLIALIVFLVIWSKKRKQNQ